MPAAALKESNSQVTPADHYRRRLREREAATAQYDRALERVGGLRLLTFGIGAAAAIWVLQTRLVSPAWLLVALALFVGLVAYHARVRRRHARAVRAVAFYRRGLARIEGGWPGQGRFGERFDDPHHVYAADLDLFGKGSLFELLCAARTRVGEDTLAAWLLAPAEVGQIRARHEAVAELRTRLDLREQWAIVGDMDEVGVHGQALRQWAQSANRLSPRWIPWAAGAMPVLTGCGVAILIGSGIASPLVLFLLVAVVFMRWLRAPVHDVLHGVENGSGDLKLLTALVAKIENEPFTSSALQDRARRLSARGVRASDALTRLATLVQLSESRENPLMGLLNVPLAYSVQVALAAERWRSAHGQLIGEWLDILGELEALISIGAYGYEHPTDPFPELIDGPAAFVGVGLGHPLLAPGQCVPNDVHIAEPTRALLISGSNMSGKSTLLRTVGINCVLAMAGAPVRAASLRLTALQVGASIRVNDSLHEGTSRFYAEILRLRQLHELGRRAPPLLFLLDELLQGTNSKDRQIGAEGVVRSYLQAGGIGLITTHDLNLAQMVAESARLLRNFHFQEEFDGGRMKFDYRLREGVLTKSNGLELMRAIGLDV